MPGSSKISDLLPPTPRQRPISLTPLIDVIFLLLIFFMLTSQTVPFSLIALSGMANKVDASTKARPSTPSRTVKSSYNLLITILPGEIIVNGNRHSLVDIDKTLQELRENGAKTAILSPRSSASVQDLIAVLEAARRTSFKSITIRRSK